VLEELTIDRIREASARIAGRVVRTPLIAHPLREGAMLYLKPELLQSVGSFKIRGALNMMLALPRICPGVVAHSSGNHAQAVARAARLLGLDAVIVMPRNAPDAKRRRTAADGAQIVLVGNDSDERMRVATQIASERGLVLVPPYDHPAVAAGQGTAALEMIVDAPEPLESFYCPVSGGGLISGCAVAFAALSPGTEIIAVEPSDANDTALSLAAGARTRIDPPSTIADGLCVRIPGERTWPVVKELVSRVELVTDDEILDAMAFALRELRLVVEPSGAVALAAALRDARGRAGVMLSGGNVDPELLQRAAARV